MPTTLIIQSCSALQQQGWMRVCMESAQQWTLAQGYDYHFIGDEIFELVPAWYREKVATKLPVATDYGRLILLRDALLNYEQAIWLDADVLVLDPAMNLDFATTCAFGQEVWVQERDGKLQARRNIHNAVAAFRRGCPILPFLIHTVESLMRRVDPAQIAPQFVGPKLLQALHPLCDFALLPQVGALSPLVVEDICHGGGKALQVMLQQSGVRPQAVNLCASLLPDDRAQALVAALQKDGL